MAKPTNTVRKDKNFSPIAAMDSVRAGLTPTCAFTCKTVAEAKSWQKRVRRELTDCVGFLDQRRVPLSPRSEGTVDRGSYVRRKVILRTSQHQAMPVYLLVPKDVPRPMPVVLAFHGHGYGAKDIVGLWEDGTERHSPDGYHKDFACELAKRGFLVAAPEISCFGERQADYSDLNSIEKTQTPYTCHNAATYATMLGKSVLGLRVWDAMRLVDYLQTLPEADTARLGTMGISGGGMHAFFSTALDPRIKACVISGYFCNWTHSILRVNHCSCNFVPGMLKLGELSDLAGLIAPRPCLIEASDHDHYFPFEGVKKTVNIARRAWRVWNAEKALQTDYFSGRHQISGAKAYDFLKAHLAQ